MNDVSAVGGKGVGLAKLVNYGCLVPDFFVITAGTVLDDDFEAELGYFASLLQCDSFSVRSSGVNEDGAQNSFAGQYLTLLNITKDNLFRAVNEVACSVHGKRAREYANHFQSCPAGMAIIVQRQIEGVCSGVVFTRSFASAEELLIESVEGAGEQLVSGAVTPQKKVTSKNNLQASEPYELELMKEALRLEELEGYPLDLEWTYSDRLYLLQMRPMTVLGDTLPVIPKRNWNFYVYRDFCLLAHSVQMRASESDLQERLFGFSVPIKEGLLVNGREFYSEESDVYAEKIWEALDKDEFFIDYIKMIKALVQRTKRHVVGLKAINFRDYSIKRLFAAYRQSMDVYIESYVPLMMRPDDYLLMKLQNVMGDSTAEAVEILTPVWKKTFYSEEKMDFLRAKISENADAYLEKYEWINNPLGKVSAPLTREDVKKRFDRITVAQAEETLKKLKSNRTQRKKNFQVYLENNCAQSSLLRLVSEFIYLRTYTAENSDRLFYYIRKRILDEIAMRLHISCDEILYMTYEEVAMLEQGQRIGRSTIAKRKSGELITFFNGEKHAYYGSGASALLTELMPYENDKMQDVILSGDVACAGELRGCVKIVRHFGETEKVEEGDIVVTSMTTPEIVSALEKAGGIITDEGGITCHAAILAREYGTPCLVGTKFATQALHDGMRIYLDCIRGEVRVLFDEE